MRQLRVVTTDRGARAWGLAWGGDERFRHLLGAKLSDSTHLAAGVGNVVIVEGIPGRAEGVDYSAFRFVDGRLVVPDTPGFGMDLAGVS